MQLSFSCLLDAHHLPYDSFTDWGFDLLLQDGVIQATEQRQKQTGEQQRTTMVVNQYYYILIMINHY